MKLVKLLFFQTMALMSTRIMCTELQRTFHTLPSLPFRPFHFQSVTGIDNIERRWWDQKMWQFSNVHFVIYFFHSSKKYEKYERIVNGILDLLPQSTTLAVTQYYQVWSNFNYFLSHKRYLNVKIILFSMSLKLWELPWQQQHAHLQVRDWNSLKVFVEFSVAVASLITTQIENVTLHEQTFCRYDLQHSYFEFLFDPCCNLYLWVRWNFVWKNVLIFALLIQSILVNTVLFAIFN